MLGFQATSRFQGFFTLLAVVASAATSPTPTAAFSDACPELHAKRPTFERSPRLNASLPREKLTDPTAYAGALFQRIVGIAISPRSPLILRMSEQVAAGDYLGAAKTALADRRFYSVRMRDFATQYSNVDSSPVGDFDDLQALFIGITRDHLDARELLTADYRYEAYPELGLPAVSLKDNRHFQEFESRGLDPWKDLVRVKDQWPELDEGAGVLTTRAWANANLSAGTNRRAVKYAMQHFLCVKMEQWRDRALPDDFVRRDVDRNNSGNPANYQNECRGCHAGMDALGGAFSRYDFVGDAFVQVPPGKVVAKYNQNSNVYPEGYVTLDDSWVNYSTRNHNEALGWRGEIQGKGLPAFGKMLSESRAFSQCLTRRLFLELCNRAPGQEEAGLIGEIADEFERDGYRIQSLVTRIATEEACLSHPGL